jgi:hypothetical protein
MSKPARLTVVYAIDDHDAFAADWKRIHELLRATIDDDNGKPYRITALSNDNEIRRVDMIEDALNRYENDSETAVDAVRAILGCADLSKFSWEE